MGRSIADRQVEFALSAGCDTIVLIGNGASDEAIALRHIAEKAGSRVQVAAGPHALGSLAGHRGSMLVMQPGLMPLDRHLADVATMGKGGIMVLPAGVGVEAGYERIDLDRAWAGLLVLPSELLLSLQQLPDDADAAAALLRIALQAGLPEFRLEEDALTEGSLVLVRDESDATAAEDRILARALTQVPVRSASQWLAKWVLQVGARRLVARPNSVAALLFGAMLLTVAGVAVGAIGHFYLGLAMIAVAVPVLDVGQGLGRLRSPSGSPAPWLRALPLVVDVALCLVGALAIEGIRLHRFGPPLTLFAALNIATPVTSRFEAIIRDRSVTALALAVLAAVTSLETAYITISLFSLFLLVFLGFAKRR